jgi:hypothetical protein
MVYGFVISTFTHVCLLCFFPVLGMFSFITLVLLALNSFFVRCHMPCTDDLWCCFSYCFFMLFKIWAPSFSHIPTHLFCSACLPSLAISLFYITGVLVFNCSPLAHNKLSNMKYCVLSCVSPVILKSFLYLRIHLFLLVQWEWTQSLVITSQALYHLRHSATCSPLLK